MAVMRFLITIALLHLSLFACVNEKVALFAKTPLGSTAQKKETKLFEAKHPPRYLVKTPAPIQEFVEKLKNLSMQVDAPRTLVQAYEELSTKQAPTETTAAVFDFNAVLRSQNFKACTDATIRAGDLLIFKHQQAPLFVGAVLSTVANYDWSHHTSKQWSQAIDSLLIADVRGVFVINMKNEKKNLDEFSPLCLRHKTLAAKWSASERYNLTAQTNEKDVVAAIAAPSTSFEKKQIGMYQDFDRPAKAWLMIENAFIANLSFGNNFRFMCGVGLKTECIAPSQDRLDVLIGGLQSTSVLVKVIHQGDEKNENPTKAEQIQLETSNGQARFQMQASLGEKIYFYIDAPQTRESLGAYSVLFR